VTREARVALDGGENTAHDMAREGVPRFRSVRDFFGSFDGSRESSHVSFDFVSAAHPATTRRAMGGLFSCCCPEDEATRLLREEEDREASQAAREQARYAAEQRHATFAQSAGGRAAHKAQAKMRTQNAADDRAAEQRIADWNS
jgi:hypothetical protein